MNLTIGNTNIGSYIKVRQVALAGGLAIAISVAAGIGAFERSSSPETATVTHPAVPVLMEEPDFGSVSVESAPAVLDPYFGTGAESVSAIEGDDLGVAQSGMVVVDPYFGTGAESVSAIEGDQLPID